MAESAFYAAYIAAMQTQNTESTMESVDGQTTVDFGNVELADQQAAYGPNGYVTEWANAINQSGLTPTQLSQFENEYNIANTKAQNQLNLDQGNISTSQNQTQQDAQNAAQFISIVQALIQVLSTTNSVIQSIGA